MVIMRSSVASFISAIPQVIRSLRTKGQTKGRVVLNFTGGFVPKGNSDNFAIACRRIIKILVDKLQVGGHFGRGAQAGGLRGHHYDAGTSLPRAKHHRRRGRTSIQRASWGSLKLTEISLVSRGSSSHCERAGQWTMYGPLWWRSGHFDRRRCDIDSNSHRIGGICSLIARSGGFSKSGGEYARGCYSVA